MRDVLLMRSARQASEPKLVVAHGSNRGVKSLVSFLVILLCLSGAASAMDWTEATDSAGWSARASNCVAFGGKMWVLGGFSVSAQYKNDVWSSADGVNWTEATDSAQWSKRGGQAAVTFEGRIWILGGKDAAGLRHDVWYSSDGANWTLATDSAGWSKRGCHTAVVKDDTIWVLGGVDSLGYRNDVWCSTDGLDWTRVTDSSDWCPRVYQSSVAFDGRIYVIAGAYDGERLLDDVWYSSDGKRRQAMDAGDRFARLGGARKPDCRGFRQRALGLGRYGQHPPVKRCLVFD